MAAFLLSSVQLLSHLVHVCCAAGTDVFRGVVLPDELGTRVVLLDGQRLCWEKKLI